MLPGSQPTSSRWRNWVTTWARWHRFSAWSIRASRSSRSSARRRACWSRTCITRLASQYADPDDPGSHHSLAVLTVRMVFCLYAEDAGLFPANAFSDLVQANDTKHLRRAIMDLFDVLDTPVPERDPYLEDELKRFPLCQRRLVRRTDRGPAVHRRTSAMRSCARARPSRGKTSARSSSAA